MKATIQQTIQEQRNRIIIAIIVLILIGCGIVFIYNDLEITKETIDLGMSSKARLNPKLAAIQFLKNSGIQAEGRPDFTLLNNLPPVDNTIVISGLRKSLSVYKYKKLKKWVNAGGVLIVTVQTLFDEEKGSSGDPFLDEMGVRQYLTEDNENTESENSEISDENTENEEKMKDLRESIQKMVYDPKIPSCKENTDAKHLSTVDFSGIPVPLVIDFSTDFFMVDASESASAEAGSDFGTHLLQYDIGRGFVTVMTDDWIWDNNSICRYDHAYLLWLLTRSSNKTWFLYQTDSPSFSTLLLRNNHILVISFLVFIFVLILQHVFRFGPILVPKNTDRRRLKEHIDAGGLYYWRNNQGYDLVNSLRKEIEKKIARYHYECESMSEKEKTEYLSKLSKIPQKDIVGALTYSEPLKESDFIIVIKYLQKLVRSL